MAKKGPLYSITPACAAKDKRLSHAEFRLLGLLGCYTNPQKDGRCWPANSTLAKEMGTGVRTCEKHIQRLIQLGYITRNYRKGRSTETNVMFDVAQGSLPLDETKVPSSNDGSVPSLSDARVPSLSDTQNDSLNDPLNEEGSEPSSTSESKHKTQSPMGDNAQLVLSAPSKGTDPETSFEDWWQHWAMPGTKRCKGNARRAYRRIVRKNEATPEDLVDGLKRYMVHCHRNAVPIQFTKHPATWLNGQCWKDELIDDQPDERTNGNGRLKSPKQLADNLAAELEREAELRAAYADANGANGQHQGDQPDSQEGPGTSDQRDGQDMPEVPAWFDHDGDR